MAGSDISSDEDEIDEYVPSKKELKTTKADDDEDSEQEDGEKEEFDLDEKPLKKTAKKSFAQALLKGGTKQVTKDPNLTEKPARKSPGRLLETAGRSLLNKSGGGSMLGSLSNSEGGNKLSFSLYGGHLPVDHGGYNKPSSADSDGDLAGGGSGDAGNKPATSRVFSNWGGEFFKKNLDYRANTNKILEKMNLGKDGGANSGAGAASGAGAGNNSLGSNGSSALSTGTVMTSFVPSERFKALLGGGPANNSVKRNLESDANSPSKKLKPNSFFGSSF